MKSVSVTELLDWSSCRYKWKYRHQDHLRPVNKPPNMVSGSVVHQVIADVLNGSIDHTMMELDAFNRLMDEFGGDQELTDKYLPGVNRALSKVPEWVWEQGWHSEQLLTMSFGTIELRGKPDLFQVNNGTLDIVEFKTTDNSPLDYLLWNPQHRYYAVQLNELYPGRVIRFRYVCLSTQGKKVVDNMPWVFSSVQLAQAKAELTQAVQEIGQLNIVHNYSRACDFCDFKDICTLTLTGGSVDGIIEEQFMVQEH